MPSLAVVIAALAAAEGAAPEEKAPAFDVSVSYTGDVVGVVDGGLRNRAT